MTKEERFEEIYEGYKTLVWGYLHNEVIGDTADKEDINQQIGMGVWKAIDRIEVGKEHAFIYQVVHRQIKKFIYYRTRDRKHLRQEETENSEGNDFLLSDLCNLIRREDEYTYFEIMDTVESILTEEEYEFFIHYLQGFNQAEIQKMMDISYRKVSKIKESVKEKLSSEFGMTATLPNFKRYRM